MSDSPPPIDVGTPLTTFDLVLEPFVPPCQSIEWRIGQGYWHDRGVQAFVMQEVPNTIINDGVRARATAHLFLANCQEAEANGTLPERFDAVELGSGLGLFARLFLDHFEQACVEAGADYHERLTLWVTDLSRRMLEDQRALDLFDRHGDRVRHAICDATAAHRLTPLDGGEVVELDCIQLVLANYTFDLLPFALLLRQDGQWFELRVQTRVRDTEFARHASGLDREGLLAAATAEGFDRDPRLRAVAPALDVERAYFPIDAETIDPRGDMRAYVADCLEPAIARTPGAQVRVPWAWSALDAITTIVAHLADDGILVVNDFGFPTVEASLEAYGYRRFGTSAAVALAFPLLDFVMQRRGASVASAPADAIAPVLSRVIGRRALPGTFAAYRALFDNAPLRLYYDLVDQARAAARENERERSDALYDQAHQIAPASWAILAEWASVANQLMSDYPRGLDLARRALAINPWTSSVAWNEYGDALYNLGQRAEARRAYRRATEVNPEHPRGWMNLAWTLAEAEQVPEAIAAACRGIEVDRDDEHRDVLNTLLEQLLDRRAELRVQSNDLMARRSR